jgi:hypothetical protein
MAGGVTDVEQEAVKPSSTAYMQVEGTAKATRTHSGNGHVGDRVTSTRAPNDAKDTVVGQRIEESIVPRPRVLHPETLVFQRLEIREGFVLSVDWDADVFRARLVDPRAVEPDQEVEVELAQVAPRDLDLVEDGALFFWAIGYVTRASGTRNLVLQIDFRRLPRPDPQVQERAKKAAQAYVEDMHWT